MSSVNPVLLILHFLGLAMGLSVTFAGMVMGGVMARSSTTERPVLARFMSGMSRLGRFGLALLWLTGGTMLYTKWNGIGSMPWQFHVKLTAVVLLTITVAILYRLEQQAQKGDTAAVARMESVAKVTSLCALIAVIFAVLTFE
jgi:uncharacterized membrane protein